MHTAFKRRLTYGTNVLAAIALALALVVMANWIARKYPRRHDFLQTSDLYQLSPKTKSVLRSLDQDIRFYVFSNPQDSELYSRLERLLKAYQVESPRISFEMTDQVRDISRMRQLVREFGVDEPDTVVITYGDRKKLLTEMDLAEFNFRLNDYTGGQIKELRQLKAEQAITSAILELVNPRKIIASFTVKHGEKSIYGYDDNGLTDAKRFLDRDNITPEPIELVGMSEIPVTNRDILVVAGPTRKFLDTEVNLIRRYLNSGGHALIMLDPRIESGLEQLLPEYNLKVGNNVVVDPERQIPGAGPLQLVVGLYRDHPITSKLQTFTLFFLARSISVLDEANNVNVAAPVALTGQRGWGETRSELDTFKHDKGADLDGPVSIACAVENQKTGMRLVVFGDSDFASNRDIGTGANRDLFMNSVNWLVKREMLVSIGPKTVAEMKRLNLGQAQLRLITIMVVLVVPSCAAVAGFFVFLARRR